MDENEKIAGKISKWIANKMEQAEAKGIVFGMSGGLDSSVVAVLCKKAFPDGSLGVMMPCESAEDGLEHAKAVAKKFAINYKVVDLKNPFDGVERELEGECEAGNEKLAAANTKARLRMAVLYHFANRLNYLVAGTGNKTEYSIGYFTKFGDGAADILPIADLFKTHVRALAGHLGIPSKIIEKPPSAGLWSGQTDEDEIGLSYELLDDALSKIEAGNEADLDPKVFQKVNAMVESSAHKRKSAPICRIEDAE